jgi:hypothetical protein
MRKSILMIIASLCCMHGAYAQDSVSVKMDQIDEYRNGILAHKNELLCVGFQLRWYADADSIFYYFEDKRLVLIEHHSDREIDGDTHITRFVAYKRVFFSGNRLCLEERYTKSYAEHQRVAEDKSRFIVEIYNYMDEERRYYNLQNDSQLSSVSRVIEAPEAIADSMLNATDWIFSDISRYRYFKGKHTTSNHLGKIEENGFVLPEGVIMPYSD